MDFGRVKNIESIDYTLANDHKSVDKILGGVKYKSPKAFVGGVLWNDATFVGNLYPPKAKQLDFLKYYTKQFNTIELNLTHYSFPDYEKLKRWYNTAPADFKFCPKINKEISHSSNLNSKIELHNECCEQFTVLGDKLGTCFLQLPPQFAPQRLNELLQFLDNSAIRNLAVEVRHPDWFKENEELKILCNYLYKNDMPFVLTDTPGRRDVLHMRLTNKTAFIRFNSNNNHATDKLRIDEWINRLKHWFDNGLQTLYFFVHTPEQVNMPHMVTYFIKQLWQVCGVKVAPPLLNTSETNNTLF